MVNNLTETINSFRNFYKPNKAIDHCEITKPIERSLDIVQSNMNSQGIEIIKDYRTGVVLDMYLNEMMQVVLNILKNATDNFLERKIKYPKLHIIVEEIADKKVQISFCDNGGGVDNTLIDAIFDPYVSTKDEKNGTGLGLYMSKTIIEDHHKGKLWVENSGEGACFKILINL